MEVINVPFVKIEDDETCALLKPVGEAAIRRPPVNVVVDEIMKVFSAYPEVKERVKLRLAKGS